LLVGCGGATWLRSVCRSLLSVRAAAGFGDRGEYPERCGTMVGLVLFGEAQGDWFGCLAFGWLLEVMCGRRETCSLWRRGLHPARLAK